MIVKRAKESPRKETAVTKEPGYLSPRKPVSDAEREAEEADERARAEEKEAAERAVREAEEEKRKAEEEAVLKLYPKLATLFTPVEAHLQLEQWAGLHTIF